MKNINKKITMDDLAAMVKLGFDETGEKFEEIKNEISEVKNDMNGLKGAVNGVKKEISDLRESNAREHQAMSLRLDNVAHRFELVELQMQKRVDVLEKKVGARRK